MTVVMRYDIYTYELDTIDISEFLHEFIDVTVNHPFGYCGKLTRLWIQLHTQQWQYVRVPKVPPRNSFLVKIL